MFKNEEKIIDTIFISFFIERFKVFYFCFFIFERTFGTYSSVFLTYEFTSPGYYYYSRREIRIFTTIIVALPFLSLRYAPNPTSYRYSVCCTPNVHASVRNQLTYLLWAEGRLIKRKTEWWTTTRTAHAVPCVNVDTDHIRIWISQGDIVDTLIFSFCFFFFFICNQITYYVSINTMNKSFASHVFFFF